MGAAIKFAQLVKAIAKHGKKAVDWCWANKGKIYNWFNAGASVAWVMEQVLKAIHG